VQSLLMGGQACVFYGAAEFSRDTDFAIVANPSNLDRLQSALSELQAEVIAVPPFSIDFLNRGHAIHFRCNSPDALGMRIDVMAKMRGVDDFSLLWERRTEIELAEHGQIALLVAVMGIEDLVRAKKTQRDKDWPMVRRLVEAHYFGHRHEASAARIDFWLQELRTTEILIEIVRRYEAAIPHALAKRSLLQHAIEGNQDALTAALREEEDIERAADRAYWTPLRAELERLRHAR